MNQLTTSPNIFNLDTDSMGTTFTLLHGNDTYLGIADDLGVLLVHNETHDHLEMDMEQFKEEYL